MDYNKRMNEDGRPDPDALLTVIQKDLARQQRGKLKIFIGMAAGSGKTYTMLEAAHQSQREGVDVVVGYVETHGRAETDALLAGLEIIPRHKLPYRDTLLEEMDTDAVMTRQPAVVLVDELAHTNAPGSRHLKRYQDVIELLEAGLTVWTTVNVQHFESRADSVREITGITVHETIPDSLLDLADEIELIDISPEDLRKRLAEGKVYTAERIELAANNFFRVGNLTALREMALRLTAEHVDHKLQDYMQLKRIAGPWKSGERLMVAVGPSPFAARLIRWTRRMAYSLEASWLAVYIDTPQPPGPEAQEQLARNIALARSLGGEVIVVGGEDISRSLLRIARQRNVTQVIIGKPQKTSRWQMLWRGGSLVDRLIKESGDIDVYVVTGDEGDAATATRRSFAPPELNSTYADYLKALLIVAVVTGVHLFLFNTFEWMEYQSVGLTALLTVLVIAVYLGRGPALLAAAVSAISWNFLFIEPRLTFTVAHTQDIILLLLYFAIAIFAGNLTARIRQQERQTRHHAERTFALYSLAHETATAVNMDDVLQTAVTQIGRVFDAEVAILLAEKGELARLPHPCSTLSLDTKEYSVALWVYDNSKLAGRFTDTLASAQGQYHPLHTATRTVGVVGLKRQDFERLSIDQELLLETFIGQIALVIERELLDEAAKESAMLRETERLYTNLLNSISHELRTPIATIKGVSSSLADPMIEADNMTRAALVEDMQNAADRLNRLVENLLDMSRLESGRLQLKREWCDLGDIIGVAVKQMRDCVTSHPLDIALSPDLPLIVADFVLLEQVIVNLLDNACVYTPPGAPIRITARQTANEIELTISDAGPGIPPELLTRIFDKFYRLPGTTTGGTGLGLSICRGLIEAHNGTLTAENLPEGGARFTIRLPLTGTPPPVQEAQNG